MAKLPYMQFYVSDYQADVRCLPMDTQGAWMQILCILWRTPRGKRRLTGEEWAREIGCPAADLSLYLKVLEHHKVGKISRELIENVEHITIISKRILREKMKQTLALKRKRKQRDTSMSRACPTNVTPKNQNQNQKSESEEEELREEKKEKKEVDAVQVLRKPSPPRLVDVDWLLSLKQNPVYAGLDIGREQGKCQAWCETNLKVFSRRRFINWLNRAERPLTTNGKQELPVHLKQFLERA